jgi:hypothetical protein
MDVREDVENSSGKVVLGTPRGQNQERVAAIACREEEQRAITREREARK